MKAMHVLGRAVRGLGGYVRRRRCYVGVAAAIVASAFFLADVGQAGYAQDFTFSDGTTNLGDGSDIRSTDGTASVQGNALRLTQDGTGNTRSAFRIPAQGNSSLGWVAKFDFTIVDGSGSNPPADGFNFSYGAIPPFNAASGDTAPDKYGAAEEGWGNVDHVSFEMDTWNVNDTEHGYNIASNIGGVQSSPDHAFVNTSILTDGTTVSGSARISWDPTHGASMTVTGTAANVSFTNVAIPGFAPDDTYIFAFGARTGGAHETLLIDNLNITTVPEPATLLLATLAFSGLGAYARRRRT